ncbi:MAG: sodium-translocating pyrophosphatase [Candidatus Terrybacteria bacterium]|nr:sodium-translocating pyrophosphatase [Candidatus Terrybacteria bacterium]
MIYFAIISSLIAITFAFIVKNKIIKQSPGNEKMREISRAIKDGSKAYLKRQYKTVFIVAVILIIVLWYFFGFKTSLGFLIGGAASALAGYFGMLTAVMANSRVAESAKSGISKAFRLAFLGGSVTGFLVAGLALFVVSVFYLITKDINSLIGLGFGGSLISVFSRLGGGIYTKAADVGADLVGKIEAGIPEDDPRNPAVIADNVGDNVGDCAGMAADLFETYAVTIIAAMLLGNLIFPGNLAIILLPLLLGGIAIIASLISIVFVKISDKTSSESGIMKGLYKGIIASAIISALGFYFVIRDINLYLAGLIGIAITFLIVVITEYYTSKKFRPVQSIAKASKSGHGTNIIAGLAISLESTSLPIVVITFGMLAAYWLAGLYGIALAAVSMLSLTGIIVAIDSFGPITDNAGGIAEMSGMPQETRKATDALDAVGNTTKAVTKGYAIGSAGLAALVLFGAYIAEIEKLGKKVVFELQDPLVLAGLFMGALLPYIFGSLSMKAVGKAAGAIVEEVRRQFREKKIMTGEDKPDYARAVDIATRSALKEMILPAILPILITIIVAIIFGPKALGGLLIGVIISGLFMAISMTSGGAAWDNAKKYIEEDPPGGGYGGKGSFSHQAAVTGDTVGDPYKDTAGPAINPMIKVVNIVALLLIPLLF